MTTRLGRNLYRQFILPDRHECDVIVLRLIAAMRRAIRENTFAQTSRRMMCVMQQRLL
jgi:hypothetical protein